MNTDQPPPELPLWLKALECLRPDQINLLTALAERGESIQEMITEALDRYRKEHRLPEDWPFGKGHIEEDDDQADHEPRTDTRLPK
jgi:hypothetical protein